MARRDLEFRIGVFVSVGLVLLIAMVVVFGEFRVFHDTYKARCLFKESVSGINPGVDVAMLGKRVGKATRIEITKNNEIEVILEIDKQFKIPVGATVTKVQRSFLGDYYLAINPPPGKIEKFVSADGSAELTGMVESSIGELAPKVSKLLSDYEPRLAELMANLNSTVASLNKIVSDTETQAYLKDTLKYTSETMAKGPNIADEVRQVVKSSQTLVANLNKATETFDKQITALGNDYQGVAKDINTLAVKLDAIFSSMKKISDKATSESTVGKLVSDEELYRKMVEAMDEAKSTLAQIKKTVKYLEENPSVVFWGDKKKPKQSESPAWWQKLFSKEDEETPPESKENGGESPKKPAE